MKMETFFNNFKKYAFRLEILQEYNVDEEKEDFVIFLRTGKVNKKINNRWHKIITAAKKRGAVIKRVHVVELPLSDYLKYEIQHYKLNCDKGEEIFIILKDEFENLKSKINYDFWMFDDEIVLKINYDSKGRFLGFDEIKNDIHCFKELKNNLLHKAIKLKEFIKNIKQQDL